MTGTVVSYPAPLLHALGRLAGGLPGLRVEPGQMGAISFGNPAHLNDLSGYTIVAVWRMAREIVIGSQSLFNKGAAHFLRQVGTGTPGAHRLQYRVARATTNYTRQWDVLNQVYGAPTFSALTVSGRTVGANVTPTADLWLGLVGGETPRRLAPTSTTAGAGNLSSDAANSLLLLGDGYAGASMEDELYLVQVYGRVLTDVEIMLLAANPLRFVPGLLLYVTPGTEVNPVFDYSPYLQHGTPTGWVAPGRVPLRCKKPAGAQPFIVLLGRQPANDVITALAGAGMNTAAGGLAPAAGAVVLGGEGMVAGGAMTPALRSAIAGIGRVAAGGVAAPALAAPLMGGGVSSGAGMLTPSSEQAVTALLSGAAVLAAAGGPGGRVVPRLVGATITSGAGAITFTSEQLITAALTGAAVVGRAGVPVSWLAGLLDGAGVASTAGPLEPVMVTIIQVAGADMVSGAGVVTATFMVRPATAYAASLQGGPRYLVTWRGGARYVVRVDGGPRYLREEH